MSSYIDLSVPCGAKSSVVLSSLMRLGWDGGALNATLNDVTTKVLPSFPSLSSSGECGKRGGGGVWPFEEE